MQLPLHRVLTLSLTSSAFLFRTTSSMTMTEKTVATRHSFTGRMCAATRHLEHINPQSLFADHQALALAGNEGMDSPMGEWILVPRTRYGDDFLVEHYKRGCRQLVLLGAGMDSRAFRTFAVSAEASPEQRVGLKELVVFEVDQLTTFDVKECIIKANEWPLTVKERHVVPFDFVTTRKRLWSDELVRKGFDPNVPTVWLLEGLLYYLPHNDVKKIMYRMGQLSAPGSAVFHDSVSRIYSTAGVAPGGAPFVSGSDVYAKLWKEFGGFDKCFVRDFKESVHVNRANRTLTVLDGPESEATPEKCRGEYKVLFVEVEKND